MHELRSRCIDKYIHALRNRLMTNESMDSWMDIVTDELYDVKIKGWWRIIYGCCIFEACVSVCRDGCMHG